MTDPDQPEPLPPVPVAPVEPSVRELHGERVTDGYGWMRDPDQPALRDYLAAERDYYDAHGAQLAGLAAELAAEAVGRTPAGDEYSVAWHLHGYSYRTRLPRGRDNLELLRTRDGDSTERVLLDENLVAAQSGHVEIGVREPSPDGDLLAWSADTSGAEIYELRIRDLRTGQDLPDVIARTYTGVGLVAPTRAFSSISCPIT